MSISVDAMREIATPIVVSAGMDLEDLLIERVGRREKVTVVVDADGGVDLDAIADVSGALSEALDQRSDLGSASYVLEVTSPGVDRPLTQPRHWRRNRDRLVRVDLVDGSTVEGRVREVDEESVTLEVSGEPRDIPFATVRRAIVQVEFTGRPERDQSDREED